MPIDDADFGDKLLQALKRIEEKLDRLQPLQVANQPEAAAGANTKVQDVANQTEVAAQSSQSASTAAVASHPGVKQIFGTDVNGEPIWAYTMMEALAQMKKTQKKSKSGKIKKGYWDINDYVKSWPKIYEDLQALEKIDVAPRPFGPNIRSLQMKLFGMVSNLPRDGRLDFMFQDFHVQGSSEEKLLRNLLELERQRPDLDSCLRVLVRDYDHHGNGLEYGGRYAYGDTIHYVKDEVKLVIKGHTNSDADFARMSFHYPGIRHHVTARFRRFIHIHGLTCLPVYTFSHALEEMAKTSENVVFIQRPKPDQARMLLNFLFHHSQAFTSLPIPIPKSDDLNIECFMEFHVVGYQISLSGADDQQTANRDTPPKHTWDKYEMQPNGYMHDRLTRIRRVSYSALITHEISSAVGRYSSWGPNYWTALLLWPQTKARSDCPYLGPGKEKPSSVFADLVLACVERMNEDWMEIAHDIDRYLSDGATFMQPDTHDTLLVDDESFSRSRKYFWVISTLSDFEDKLETTIDQWPLYRVQWKTSWQSGHPDNWGEAECKKLDLVEDRIKDFRDMLAHFRALRMRATALRDGLFNASSVMESRAANHLGQNVKQLTMVSIFFLPLAFTTSVFSINVDAFNPSIIPGIACLVGLLTYVVVFNLNNIVSVIRYFYYTRRTKVVNVFSEPGKMAWSTGGYDKMTFNKQLTSPVPKSSKWFIIGHLTRGTMSMLWGKMKDFMEIRKKQKTSIDVEASVQAENKDVSKVAGKATAEQVERVSIELREGQEVERTREGAGVDTS